MEEEVKPILILGALTLVTALSAVPAIAQTAATHATTMAQPPAGLVIQHDCNPVMTQMGDARASKVIGSSVYNDDEKVGSVDDLLVGKDGKIEALLSVGGFLGMSAWTMAAGISRRPSSWPMPREIRGRMS